MLAVCACSTHERASRDPATTTFSFGVDAPASGEAYACYGFDATSLAGRYLHAVRWAPPPDGAVVLHHASLYAYSGAYPDGPVPCDVMPAALAMHVWGRGGDPLELPADVGIALAKDLQRFVVQIHAIRTAGGPPAAAAVAIEASDTAPAHVAAWLGASAGVPAIRPHMQEQSTASCRAASPMHVVFSWPHMHRIGKSFHGAIVRADGTRVSMVDVPTWSFDRQVTYRVDADIAAGDAVETSCIWQNDSDAYVLPGPRSSDEMCGHGLIVWPAGATWVDCQ